jgi:DNA-binding SARP family transcriptional activator
MSALRLFLLGSPRVERAGQPVSIELRKAVALLVYLAVTKQGHSRDALATLFWPEMNQSRARAGLRYVLVALRKALAEGRADDEYPLDVDRETVGLNHLAEIWLDVDEFQDLLGRCRTHDHPEDQVCPTCLRLLATAANLYHADFLAGFTLRDSPTFDEWQFFQTEGLRNELLGALARLAQGYADQGEFEPAITHARRWAALDPLHEPAHRQLMKLYARSGQRPAALRQYETCCRALRAELSAEPGAETRSLFEQIRAGEPEVSVLSPERSLAVLPERPAFLTEDEDQVASPRPVFVARERELAQLDAHLAAALDGHGRVVFVTGEAGCGKTALMDEFARRAMEV